MTTNTLTDFLTNTPAALQAVGARLADYDVDAIAHDLHALADDPKTTTPAQVIRKIGGIKNDVLPEYAHGTAHPVRLPARDNLDPHAPATTGGDDLADRQGFTYRAWLQAVQSLRAAATDLGVDPAQFDAAQTLTDLLQGTEQDITVDEHAIRRLRGAYGMDAFAAALAGDAAPGGEEAQDVDGALDLTGTWF